MEVESNSDNNKRIAKNTLFLYFRQIITMFVSLYTSRVVLRVLGVEDYGIYGAVGSIVGMLIFLNGTMAAATQRFLSFEIGKKDLKALTKVYSITIQVHLIIALVIVLLAETVGLWFLYTKMNFPPERLNAVFWVYQFSVFNLALSVTQVPYNAAIIAFEKMNIYAYMSLLDVVLKLLCAFLLGWINYDKLILYAVLIFLISLFIRSLYVIYVHRNIKACRYQPCKDMRKTKEILSYAGYNFIGHFSLILKTQGTNILLNIFFGPLINAANAVAIQVKTAIDSFSQNFIVAVNPQIVKSYAANNLGYMKELILQSSKFTFILLSFFAIPFLLEANYVISLWLENPPEYSVLFCRLMVINVLIDALSGTLVYGALATGNVKKYQLVVGSLFLMILPASYLFLKLGYDPEITIIVSIFFSFVALFIRLYLLKGLINFPVTVYLRKVVLVVSPIFLLSAILPAFIIRNLDPSFFRLILTIFSSCISIIIFFYGFGLNKQEKGIVIKKTTIFLSKILHR